MKKLAAMVALLSIGACASQLTLVEQSSGLSYSGQMQGSLSDEGDVSVEIDGVQYDGRWAIENTASGINFGKVKQSEDGRVTTTRNTQITFGRPSAAPDTVVEFARLKERSASFLALESYSGNGRMVMKSAAGDELLCSFQPNELGGVSSGFCTREDGTSFDLFKSD
jgi:hypothetical protein